MGNSAEAKSRFERAKCKFRIVSRMAYACLAWPPYHSEFGTINFQGCKKYLPFEFMRHLKFNTIMENKEQTTIDDDLLLEMMDDDSCIMMALQRAKLNHWFQVAGSYKPDDEVAPGQKLDMQFIRALSGHNYMSKVSKMALGELKADPQDKDEYIIWPCDEARDNTARDMGEVWMPATSYQLYSYLKAARVEEHGLRSQRDKYINWRNETTGQEGNILVEDWRVDPLTYHVVKLEDLKTTKVRAWVFDGGVIVLDVVFSSI